MLPACSPVSAAANPANPIAPEIYGNQDFVAAGRQDVPALILEIRRLWEDRRS